MDSKTVKTPFKKTNKPNPTNNEENNDDNNSKSQAQNNFGLPPEPGDFLRNELAKRGITEDTLGLGYNIGRKFVKDSKFIDYFSLNGLKPYFQVNNKYVVTKLKNIFIPLYLFKKDPVEEDSNSYGDSNGYGNNPYDQGYNNDSSSFNQSGQSNNQNGSQSQISGNNFNADARTDIPKSKIEYPDLYIPVMAFITYVLLIGFNSSYQSNKM